MTGIRETCFSSLPAIVAPRRPFVMPSSHDVFGAKITPMTTDTMLTTIKEHVDDRRQCLIAYQNMHGMHVRLSDERFERLHQLAQTYVYIDGMPIVLLCRLRHIAATRSHRFTLVDFVWPLLQFAANERRRVYYIGGSDAVITNGIAAILRRVPNLAIRGRSGYFNIDDAEECSAIVRDVRDFRPDIVLVGMGMGRQEHWILKHYQELAPSCVYAVGACMEYLAGAVKTPPRWLGPAGLEWLFRLCEHPERFAYRYFIEPWKVLSYLIRHSAATKESRGVFAPASIERTFAPSVTEREPRGTVADSVRAGTPNGSLRYAERRR